MSDDLVFGPVRAYSYERNESDVMVSLDLISIESMEDRGDGFVTVYLDNQKFYHLRVGADDLREKWVNAMRVFRGAA